MIYIKPIIIKISGNSQTLEELRESGTLFDSIRELLDLEGDEVAEVQEDPDEILISWCVDDVKSIAPDLTNEQCREVLRRAKQDHDATIGINWEVLEVIADAVRDAAK